MRRVRGPAVRGPAVRRPAPSAAKTPPATLTANLFVQLKVNVADLGYVVDPGAYDAPDQPHSPDQPRYLASAQARQHITGPGEPAGPVRHAGHAAAARTRDTKILQQPAIAV
jgi:hypothetical protein